MLHTRRCAARTGLQPLQRQHRLRQRLAMLSLAAGAAQGAWSSRASAANGIWSGNSAGSYSWSISSNWSGGVVAGGADAIADFNSIDLLGDATIALDASVTVGNLLFGDTDPTTTAAGWTIAGPNALTLQVSSGAPTITVNALGTGKVTRIDAAISSAAG